MMKNAIPPSTRPTVWYDGKSALPHTVTLSYRPFQKELRICSIERKTDNQPLAIWEACKIRVLSGRLEDAAVAVRLGLEADDGQRLVVQDPQVITTLHRWLRNVLGEHRGRVRRNWLMGTLAAWTACIFLYFISPLLFTLAAAAIPQSWEEALGKSARETIVNGLGLMPGIRSVNLAAQQDPDFLKLVERLEAAAPSTYTFDVMILDADFVNAFALPGGYMVVSTGLVGYCQSPDELAGVLAHEMAHVTKRHGTARLLREYLWTLVTRLLSGSETLATGLAKSVVTSSFDRDDERDADAIGVNRLIEAGINPLGMADFFSRLQDSSEKNSWRIESYLASHPELDERRDSIHRYVKEAEGDGRLTVLTPAMSHAEWTRFKQLCKKRSSLTEDEYSLLGSRLLSHWQHPAALQSRSSGLFIKRARCFRFAALMPDHAASCNW